MQHWRILLVAGALLLVAASSRTGSLDGTSWTTEVVPDAEAVSKGENMFKDTLVFADGKFTSTACLAYGFKASPYVADAAGGVSKWKSEQTSEKEGSTTWTGEAKGIKITGDLAWKKKDGTTLHYVFIGKKTSRPTP